MLAANSVVRAAAVFAFALVLAGCVTPTPYQAAAPRGNGYSEERLDRNKFRVTFKGNAQTPREVVEDYLLYRAAELTLQNGFDHFVMVGRETEAKTSYRAFIDHFGGRGFFYHGFPGWRYDPWWGPGPWGPPHYDVQPVTTYAAYADIIMVKGPRQDGDIRAFDARQVIAEVGPRVVRPEDQQRR